MTDAESTEEYDGPTHEAWEAVDKAIQQWQRERPHDDRDAYDLITSLDFNLWLRGEDPEEVKRVLDDDFGSGILEGER